MRLTLRTLLAYLDDTLEPTQTRTIGQKVGESEVAQELIERIKRVTRRRGLSTPPVTGGPPSTDSNTVAEYLDNALPADALAEFEETALDSDSLLAEVAACHQILTLVLGEPARVPPTARQRMYRLVKGRESIPYRRPAATVPVGGLDPDALPEERHEADEALLMGLPMYAGKGAWARRLAPIGGLLVLLAALVVAIRQAIPPSPAPQPGTTPTDVAYAAPRPDTSPKVVPPATTPENGTKPEPKVEPKKGPATGKEPEPKKKEPEVGPPPKKEPEPKKEPLVVPVAKPSTERRELATFNTQDNVLLSRAKDGAPWKRVLLTAPRVSSTDPLVCLPGYHGELRLDSGVRLGLWGNLPEFQEVPVLEARLTLHAPPPGLDADFTLGAGRVFITTRKAKGPTRVRLRFKGEVWDLTLPDGDTEVAADLFGRFPPGVPFSREPGGDPPQAVLMLGVLKGRAEIRPNDKKPLAADAPSAVIWESKKGSVEGPNKEEAAALGGYFSRTPTGRQQLVREMEEGLSDFSKRLAPPDAIVEVVLTSALKDDREKPSRRYLAVQFLQAIDDLRDLADALGDEAVFVRVAAINALRHWIGGAADRDQQLYQVLVKHKDYEAGQAVVVLQLLHSPAREELDKPETFATLFDFLGHEKLAVRELALWHLSRLDPDGLRDALKKAKLEKFGPDMAAPPEVRTSLIDAWKDSWKRRFVDKKGPPPKKKSF